MQAGQIRWSVFPSLSIFHRKMDVSLIISQRFSIRKEQIRFFSVVIRYFTTARIVRHSTETVGASPEFRHAAIPGGCTGLVSFRGRQDSKAKQKQKRGVKKLKMSFLTPRTTLVLPDNHPDRALLLRVDYLPDSFKIRQRAPGPIDTDTVGNKLQELLPL